MTLIKYLVKCVLDFITFFDSATGIFLKEFLIGFVTFAIVASIFIVSFIFLNWYFAIIITIGVIIAFCVVSILIEIIVSKIIDKKRND